MTEIAKIRDDEEANYQKALDLLGDTASLPEAQAGLYRLVVDLSRHR